VRSLERTIGRAWAWRGAKLAVRLLEAPIGEHELSAKELSLVDAARAEHRRQQLRAGRAIAHAVARAAGLRSRVEVLQSESGRPRLSGAAAGWRLSLSHGGALAAAIIGHSAVGIDVEPLSREAQVTRVVAGWGRRRGRQRVPTPSLPLPLALLQWTAWEAMGKLTGKGVLAGAKATIRPELGTDGLTAQARGRHLRWWLVQGHVLCAAVIE
jgi:phosphopantetheinyl transferase